jgi:poly(3-hydroxybutyrate) depolymerase
MSSKTPHAVAALAVTLLLAAPVGAAPRRVRDRRLDVASHTRTWVIAYRAHTGHARLAYVLLPRWYGPRAHSRIPLVISPHGRGTSGRANAKLWGDLPSVGAFAVVNPDGEGDALGVYSWGAPGQIEDLARMPEIVHRALPWLRIDRRRIYAFGGSMGGQETLLLLAKHPELLAGAAAFDSVVDFAHQYRRYGRLPCNARCRAQLGTSVGTVLQRLARTEVGGDPATSPRAYAARSPITHARAIADACVPLQLWWSRRDRILVDPERQSGRLLREVRRINRTAPITGIEGTWTHSAEMRPHTRLPFALARFGLMPPAFAGAWGFAGARVTPPADVPCVHGDHARRVTPFNSTTTSSTRPAHEETP